MPAIREGSDVLIVYLSVNAQFVKKILFKSLSNQAGPGAIMHKQPRATILSVTCKGEHDLRTQAFLNQELFIQLKWACMRKTKVLNRERMLKMLLDGELEMKAS